MEKLSCCRINYKNMKQFTVVGILMSVSNVGKSFTCCSSLKTHRKIHTGEKLSVWKQCRKTFNPSFSPITHERIHTGEKSYLCTQCRRVFTDFSLHHFHGSIHSKKKSCKCKYCGKPSLFLLTLKCKNEYTLEKNLMYGNNAGKSSLVPVL